MIKIKYSCEVIDKPKKNCPHFKWCLKKGKEGVCLLSRYELEQRKNAIKGYTKRLAMYGK